MDRFQRRRPQRRELPEKGPGGEDVILVVCNFTPVARTGTTGSACRRRRPLEGDPEQRRRRTTAAAAWATSARLEAVPEPLHGRSHSLDLTLPPLGVLVFKREMRPPPTSAICIHGHFYQPPRENAWLEEIEIQDSAAPYHDWNERVSAECYAPELGLADPRRRGPHRRHRQQLRLDQLRRRPDAPRLDGEAEPGGLPGHPRGRQGEPGPDSAATGAPWPRPTTT